MKEIGPVDSLRGCFSWWLLTACLAVLMGAVSSPEGGGGHAPDDRNGGRGWTLELIKVRFIARRWWRWNG